MDLADARYQIIAPLLRRYQRRFTLLDMGAGINPYMAQRISQEFDAVVVAIEQDEIVPEECEKFGPRALWLRKKMSADDLRHLEACEHFDITLALNFLHHSDKWWSALNSLNQMAHWNVYQTPYMSDTASCGQDIVPEIGRCLQEIVGGGGLNAYLGETAQFPGHAKRPIYLLEGRAYGQLTSSSWTSPDECIDAVIDSDYNNKTIEVRNYDGIKPRRPYIHGLNLWNFAQLGGAWPRKDVVLKLIREFPLPEDHHGDITPHNFLFDGKELFLIDGHEGWEFSDEYGLKQTEQMVGDLLQ